MTKGERIIDIARQLENWEAVLAVFDRQLDAFAALTTAQPDSPLLDAIYKMEAAYTEAVAAQLGDANGWLLWFRWECDMGKKPLKACCRAGEPMRDIRTLKQLARLVAG